MNFKSILQQHCLKAEIDEWTGQKITYNSKEVESDTLFFCKGATFKKEYLDMAIQHGATAYVSEIDYHVSIPLIQVDHIAIAMAKLAKEFYQDPSSAFTLIGITGTKGKSTTTYYLKQILETAQHHCGILSSIDTYDGITQQESRLTTPEALVLYQHFYNAKQSHLDSFVMEVSSQGLKYHRVDGVEFDYGIFLNIGEDHISPIEHPHFEDYFHSKLKIFNQSKIAVVNLDSKHSDQILAAAQACHKVITFSQHRSEADYTFEIISTSIDGTTFKLNDELFMLGMSGLFNVENACAAIIVALDLGIDVSIIKQALKEIKVPGRMEVFHSQDQQLTVIVDYAHNTLSFEKLFESSRQEYPDSKMIIIFGCPGNKAINRRKDLGEVSNRFADEVILTMEDPATEDPTQICDDIKQYIPDVDTQIIIDRKEALKAAIDSVKGKTLILFTGKGAETREKIGNDYVPRQSDTSMTAELIQEYDKRSPLQ